MSTKQADISTARLLESDQTTVMIRNMISSLNSYGGWIPYSCNS
jgi:hypothetical protein